jgi:hypothetical protein
VRRDGVCGAGGYAVGPARRGRSGRRPRPGPAALPGSRRPGPGDDLKVLFYSGHGLKDASGRLCFAGTDSRRHLLAATGISAGFLDEAMSDCWARRLVLILDCCYSGAFPIGVRAKSQPMVGVVDRLARGRGRVVITSSTAIEYAFEGLAGVGRSPRGQPGRRPRHRRSVVGQRMLPA